jgi:GNAT superfamily N-acetyltransferase
LKKRGRIYKTPKDGKKIVLRPFGGGDSNRVIDLMREVYIEEMGWHMSFLREAIKILKDMLITWDPKQDLFVLAEFEGTLVGLLYMVSQSDGRGLVRWLTVKKDYRGMGIGKRLLEMAVYFARKKRHKKIVLVTVDELKRAREVYARAGFVETGRKADFLWNMNITLCFMEMKL